MNDQQGVTRDQSAAIKVDPHAVTIYLPVWSTAPAGQGRWMLMKRMRLARIPVAGDIIDLGEADGVHVHTVTLSDGGYVEVMLMPERPTTVEALEHLDLFAAEHGWVRHG